jgi:hypothetical protein
MSKFVELRIADCHARLRDVHKQIESLTLRAASIEGELRAYENVRDQPESITLPKEAAALPIEGNPPTAPSLPLKRRKSRLSPPWQAAFKELVSTFPETLSRATIEDIARKYGPITDSFRTALWHHVRRGYVEELDNGVFRANKETAYRAGIPWEEQAGEPSELQNEFSLGERVS